MAVDLLGAFSMERVRQYLERKEWLKKEHVDLEQLAALLSGLQGIRLGVKIDEQPLGRIAVDFSAETSWTKPFVKRLLLEILADAGMLINDLENWEGDAKGKEIGLQGYFSKDGLRDALCLIQSPAPTINVAESTPASKTPEVDPAAASQQHFGKVVGYLKELMSKKKDIQTFGQHAILFDRYAGRIEKLPILGVDKELIQYSAFVAQQLRNGSQIVRMKGVRTGVQQSNAVVSGSGDVYTYGYVNGWYGDYGYAAYNPRARLPSRYGGQAEHRNAGGRLGSRPGAADQEPDPSCHERHPPEDDGEIQGRVCALAESDVLILAGRLDRLQELRRVK
jgi:hypothetical protein